ncbi:hypothetical protein AHAS_Ahas06G0083000 [Arachis hypogaea]
MSGLKINYDKSVVIGLNCREETIDEACGILECNKAKLLIRYLGIPLGTNPKRVKTWDPIIKKVEERLKGWEGKFLTKAGKLVLIKVVLNSLPMYYLSMFKNSKAVAAKIISLQSKFFWGKADGGKGMPTVKWSVVQKPKKKTRRFGGERHIFEEYCPII